MQCELLNARLHESKLLDDNEKRELSMELNASRARYAQLCSRNTKCLGKVGHLSRVEQGIEQLRSVDRQSVGSTGNYDEAVGGARNDRWTTEGEVRVEAEVIIRRRMVILVADRTRGKRERQGARPCCYSHLSARFAAAQCAENGARCAPDHLCVAHAFEPTGRAKPGARPVSPPVAAFACQVIAESS